MIELKQVDTPEGHLYIDNEGKEYHGVTSVFKLISAVPLELWSLRIGERGAKRISVTAAAYGHGLHKVWEDICTKYIESVEDIEERVKPRFKPEARKLLTWFLDHVETIYYTEHRVVDLNLQVAGTVDTVCKLKGRDGLAVLDLKTGKLKNTAKMQMAVYRQGVADTLGIPLTSITERVILSCNRERKVAQEYYFGIDDSDYIAYKNLSEFYRWSISPSSKMNLREAKKK